MEERLLISTSRLFRFGLSAVVVLCAAVTALPAAAADCNATPASELDWSGCSKTSLMLSSSQLDKANLKSADLSLTDLSGSDLSGANLEKARLLRTWLAGATAKGTVFARIEAYRASFKDIKAEGASFVGAELQRADFTGADLTRADFEKAELSRVVFDKAVLTGARFSLTNLSRARLSGATFDGPIDFSKAFLFLTRIEGLDLSAATGLTQDQVALSCGNAETKLPPGLTIPETWPCHKEDAESP